MAMVPFTGSFASLLVATIVMGFGNGLGSGTMMTLGADLAPREGTGEFLGVWRLIGDTGAVTGPPRCGKYSRGAGVSSLSFRFGRNWICWSCNFPLARPGNLAPG